MEPTFENCILDLLVDRHYLINTVTISERLDSCDHKIVHTEIITTNVFKNKTLMLNLREDNFKHV